MGKSKKKERKANVDPENLEIEDVVAIEWYDVHAYERIELAKSMISQSPKLLVVGARSSERGRISCSSPQKLAIGNRMVYG